MVPGGMDDRCEGAVRGDIVGRPEFTGEHLHIDMGFGCGTGGGSQGAGELTGATVA